MNTSHQKVVIIGGGSAGITVAARLLRKGYGDVSIIEPSDTHYYQPLWTLVGGGQADIAPTARPEASVMPRAPIGFVARRQRSTRIPTPSRVPTEARTPTTR